MGYTEYQSMKRVYERSHLSKASAFLTLFGFVLECDGKDTTLKILLKNEEFES